MRRGHDECGPAQAAHRAEGMKRWRDEKDMSADRSRTVYLARRACPRHPAEVGRDAGRAASMEPA